MIPEGRRRGRRRASDRVVHIAFRLVSIAAVLLAIAVVVLIVQNIQKNQALDKATSALRQSGSALGQANQTESRLRHDEVRLCHRLNVHRIEQDDANWYREWKFDRFFLSAIVHPLRPQIHFTSASERRAERRQLQDAKVYLTGIVNGLTWTPATKSCLAPGEGSQPVRFIVRQPTKAELTLAKGQ